MTPTRRSRSLRLDARQNRARVLDVARRLFEAKGPSVGMDDVARSAGVGVGTIYRHFPTKEALIQGVLESHVGTLIAAANERARATDPRRAFFEYLEFLAGEFLAGHRIHQAVARAGFSVAQTAEHREGLQRALGTLLSRAQATGAVRADVTAAEVILLLRGALLPGDEEVASVEARRRMFDVVRTGLEQPRIRR